MFFQLGQPDQRSEVGAGPQRRALLIRSVKRVWVGSDNLTVFNGTSDIPTARPPGHKSLVHRPLPYSPD